MSLPSEQNWLVLNNLLNDLTKKGYNIPNGINSEMGIIRSTISSYKRDPSHPDLINGLAKAEMSLNNIQVTLLTIAEEEGEDYVDYWLDLLKQVMQGKKVFEFADSKARFLVNSPPGLTTGRINLKVPLAEERRSLFVTSLRLEVPAFCLLSYFIMESVFLASVSYGLLKDFRAA